MDRLGYLRSEEGELGFSGFYGTIEIQRLAETFIGWHKKIELNLEEIIIMIHRTNSGIPTLFSSNVILLASLLVCLANTDTCT